MGLVQRDFVDGCQDGFDLDQAKLVVPRNRDTFILGEEDLGVERHARDVVAFNAVFFGIGARNLDHGSVVSLGVLFFGSFGEVEAGLVEIVVGDQLDEDPGPSG